jgi:hypothetical protein
MQTKNANENMNVEKSEVEPVDPITGKKIMLGCGATGFAMCFAGILYGNQVFILGFVVMVLGAAGFYATARKN